MTNEGRSGPSFFIAGAPKCGTTALYSYLKAHPKVFMPDLKEPHFFSVDLPGIREINQWPDYLALFDAAPDGTLRGEASASYLMSEEAIGRILSVQPAAKFILILRNPIEMAHAFHAELLYNLNEDVEDFSRAWDLQGDRARGRHLPPGTKETRLLQYRAVCSIGDQLERFLGQVPSDQRLILLFDDLKADPSTQYLGMLEHLGLPDDGRRVFSRENPSRILRSRWLASFHRSLPRRLGRVYPLAKACGNALLSDSLSHGLIHVPPL